MKTKYLNKYISLPIILVLLMSGIFPVGIRHASANGEPYIMADPSAHWINAYYFKLNVPIYITIYDPFTEETIFDKVTYAWDEGDITACYFNLGDLDLLPNVLVTVNDGTTNKQLIIANFAVNNIDFATNTITGKGSPNAYIGVFTDLPVGYSIGVNTDNAGFWSAIPVNDQDVPADLHAGDFGWAAEYDEDGDMTRMDWRVPNPRFDVRANADQVEAWEWTYGETVTLTINTTDIFTATVGKCPWDSNSTYVSFNLAGEADAIKVGDWVSVTNGEITKVTQVSELEITEVDVLNDIVSGKATPNGELDVWACDSNGCPNLHITVKENGTWIADFSEIIDLVSGTWVDSKETDVDGDSTMYGRTGPKPLITAYLSENRIDTNGWELGVPLDITISVDGESKYLTTLTPAPWEWDHSVGYGNLVLGPDFVLESGMLVTISNSDITRSLTVNDLYVTAYDPKEKTVAGHVNPDTLVRVSIWDENGGEQWTTSTNGEWAVGFDPDKPAFMPWADGDVTAWDEFGNETKSQINVGSIYTWPEGDTIVRDDCTLGKIYTLTIEDLSDGSMNGYTNKQQCVRTEDGMHTWINFQLPSSSLLAAGDTITIESGHDIRTLVITPRGQISFDTETGIVSGQNNANRYIRVMPDGPWENGRTILTEPDGTWSIDFSEIGPNDEPMVPITPGMGFGVLEYDEVRNNVGYWLTVPNPRFEVRPNIDQVRGWDWTVGDILTLEVDGQVYTGEVGVTDWDPNQSYIEFNLADIYDIQPGDYVSLSYGTVTKDTTVTYLDLTEVNIVLDTVSGKAAPGTNIDLWVCNTTDWINFYRHVTANANGNWIADFSTFGDLLDEKNTFDIVPGTWVDSQQVDEDGDATMSGATVRNPNFVVNPTGHWAYAWDWPADQDLTLSAGGFKETVTNYSTGQFTSEAYFDLTDVELNADDIVAVSGAGIDKTLMITDFTVALDVLNNTLSGTASPEGFVFACADNAPGNCRPFATADENGDWSMSPDPEGFVLAPGVFGWAAEGDKDGDMTRMDWLAPMPTSGSAVGEGWFSSPAGVYTADPAFAGKAVIQFDAKYSKKTAMLSGSVQFSFKRFAFVSTSLEWLAIDGGRMQLSGQGKVNGKVGYSFMLSAAEDSPDMNGSDTVHIRIWETATGNVIYDNMPGVPDYVLPITVLQGGVLILTP
jgi:hypothetical protein